MGAVVPVPVGGTAVGGAAVTPKAVGSSGAAVSQTQRVVHPPASFLANAQTAILEGTGGGTICGSWYPVGSYYVWYSHSDGVEATGVDPGDYEASLSGLTGVEVALASGSHTGIAVATATETAWNAAGTGVTAVRTGDSIDYTGSITAVTTTGGAWASRGSGHGTYGTTDLASSASFGLDTTRFHQVLASNLPSTAFRIVGVRVKRGNNVGAGFRLAVYTDGTADGDPENAVLQAEKEVAANGTGEWSAAYFAPDDVVEIGTPGSTRVWIGMQGSGATSSISAENVVTQPPAQGDFYVSGSNQVLFITGQNTGAGTAFPATAGAVASSNNFAVWVQLIVQVAPYYGDAAWRSWAGPTPGRNDTSLTATSNMNSIWVAWAWDLPAVTGLRMYTAGVYLPVHSALQQPRLELWDNVTDVADADGETIVYDFGQTSGSTAGWSDIDVSGGVDVDGGGLYRISVKCDPTGGPSTLTQIGFNTAEHDEAATPDEWGWGGDDGLFGSTETEYTSAAGETTIDFDPSVATASPNTPDSTVINPGNSGGVHALIGHNGFVITANP